MFKEILYYYMICMENGRIMLILSLYLKFTWCKTLFPQKSVMFLIVIRQEYYFHTTLYNMWQLCAMDQFFLKFSITGSDKKNFSSPVTKSEVKENSFEKSHCQ